MRRNYNDIFAFFVLVHFKLDISMRIIMMFSFALDETFCLLRFSFDQEIDRKYLLYVL